MSTGDPDPPGDLIKHRRLAGAMARTAGADLAGALLDGRLDQDVWTDVVQTCRGCNWERDGACSRWLSGRRPDTASPPETCPNRKTLLALRDQTHD